MERYLFFLIGTIFGTFITFIMAYIYAERIATVKQSLREENRKRGTPLFWHGKWQGRLFIKPDEAAFVPKEDTYNQYPTKEELAQKPGPSNDEFYDLCFSKYIINRKLNNKEAWTEAQKDHPEFFPKKIAPDYQIKLDYTKKAYFEAMRRRRGRIGKKN